MTLASVKILFRLTQDEDGYPPVAVESVWAHPDMLANEYILDNIPFFSCDATLGDTVVAHDEDGGLWFKELVRASGSSLIRVVFFDRDRVQQVSEHLAALGCEVEYTKSFNLLSVSVPSSTRLDDVQEYLRAEQHAGTIDYEEAILRT